MYTIRTNIPRHEQKSFRYFLENNKLGNILIGDYEKKFNSLPWVTEYKLCYAYSDKDLDVVENLTYLILKYGSLESAYYKITSNK